jgi:hypothetical protein
LKKFCRNIKKLYNKIDVSPFAYGKLKIIIFLIWGTNVLLFLGKDIIAEHCSISPEQLSIVSRELFDYNITIDSSGSLDVNLVRYVAGVINDSGIETIYPEYRVKNSSRAPPEYS